MAGPETVQEDLSLAETEIESLMAGRETPEGLRSHFDIRVEEKRKLPDGRRVEISVYQWKGKPRTRDLYVGYPHDELGRFVSETFNLTKREYEKLENPYHRDWKGITVLDDREMTEEDDLRVMKLIEEFKLAEPEDEADDDKKDE
jgi:hypothetical protein